MRITMEDFKYVLEFIETHSRIDYAKLVARAFRKYILPFYMDLRENEDNYLDSRKKFWKEVFEDPDIQVDEALIEKLTRDEPAPFVFLGQTQSMAIDRGYSGGDEDIDFVANDILSFLR